MSAPLLPGTSASVGYDTFSASVPGDTAQTGGPAAGTSDTDNDISTFSPGDAEDPRNWSSRRKWSIVAVITLIDLSVSWGASGFSPANESFADDMKVSSTVATLGLSMYVLGLAAGPMSLAPLSEYYGRNGIYIGSYGIYLCWLAGSALVKTMSGFLILRLLSGVFASVTIANFGGTIADLWHPHETGPAMSIFLWAACGGSPSGYFIFSLVAVRYPWRTVLWSIFAVGLILWLLMTLTLLVLGETRHPVILRRRARKVSLSTPTHLKPRSISTLFSVALSRPFRFLGTEAIIAFAALSNGLLFGLSFLFNSAFPLVFGSGHNFTTSGVGAAFLGIFAGISIGPFTNIWQEQYYQRRVSTAGGASVPEARVQLGKVAAWVFPVSILSFAWTSSPNVHPGWPIAAAALWGWSFYTLILMAFQYTEDSYKTYSASALAGIGLVRNLFGAAFPVFATSLFKGLGSRWAGTVLGAAALMLVPVPFVWERFGERLRKRSPWARGHVE